MDNPQPTANSSIKADCPPKKRGLSPLRVTIVGPQHPHTGGIANHTTELADELEKHATVQRISYRTLYPKCLYPGEYRASVATNEGPDSPHTLHYGNPLSWRRALRRIIQFRPDAVVMTWWTFFLTPVNAWLESALRRKGIPVYFICHNVFDHEGHPLKAVCSRFVLRKASGCVVHAAAEVAKIESFAPAMPVLKTPLFCSSSSRLPASPATALRPPLRLLFFGYIRPYKGLADLAAALPLLQSNTYELAVVGEWWSDHKELRHALSHAPIPVTVSDRFVTDEEKQRWFEWADAVVLPYRSATASGVVADAYNFGKPVITTAVGGIPEVVIEGKTGFLATPANPQSLAEAINRFKLAADSGVHFSPHLEAMRQSLEVSHYATKLVEFLLPRD